MASDKIIKKILDNAQAEAQSIQEEASKKAQASVVSIEKEAHDKIKALNKKLEEDLKETQRRAKLTCGMEERKILLEDKRYVLNMAFDKAYDLMKDLPEHLWAKLIKEVVLEGCVTGTEMVRVPKKDTARYTQNFLGKGPFLDQLNQALKERGLEGGLVLSDEPAGFEEGIMLIGEYSDVNGSFEVLLKNSRETLEWDVTKILFPEV